MIGFNIHKSSPSHIEKINSLCTLLKKGTKEYEKLSGSITNKEIRNTVLTLAQESNQYACELYSQVLTLGGTPQKTHAVEPESDIDCTIADNENKLLSFCSTAEKKMVSAYHEVLNESFLNEGLRKMIRYQLNGILCSFMQLKLLNSLIIKMY